MNLFDDKLNLRLNIDLDIEAQDKTNAHGRQRLYKRKVANRF